MSGASAKCHQFRNGDFHEEDFVLPRLIRILAFIAAATVVMWLINGCAVVIYADNGATVTITSKVDSEVTPP